MSIVNADQNIDKDSMSDTEITYEEIDITEQSWTKRSVTDKDKGPCQNEVKDSTGNHNGRVTLFASKRCCVYIAATVVLVLTVVGLASLGYFRTETFADTPIIEVTVKRKLNVIFARCQDCCSFGTWLCGGHTSVKPYREELKKLDSNLRHEKLLYSINNYSSMSMSVINGRLWVPVFQSIHVLSPITEQRHGNIFFKKHMPVALLQHHHNVIMATANGLYILNLQGTVLGTIMMGGVLDISVDNSTLAVYKNNSVLFLRKKNWKWVQIRKFSHKFSYKIARIHFHNNTIYLSTYTANCIRVYDLSGRILRRYGSTGNGVAGMVRRAMLCGVDIEGSVLICDYSNHRLQILSKDGNWTVIPLHGIQYPQDVIVDNTGKIWIKWENNPYKITLYS